MELGLMQRQELKLVMTYDLRQAIELLQYSTHDLYQFLKEKELENPLIELTETNEAFPETRNSRHQSFRGHSNDIDFGTLKDRDSNMRELLAEQALLLSQCPREQKLIKYLVFNLDDNGYLDINREQLTKRGAYSEEEVIRGIQLLRTIGPSGIAAETLAECLLLQIPDKRSDAELIRCLIQHHLYSLSNRKWKDIAASMNIPLSKINEIYEFILTLNPKPCSFISDFATEYMIPDIIVKANEKDLTFSLNDSYLPSISCNQHYIPLMSEKNETAKYLSIQYKNYQWLLNSIEQRRQTICKVMAVIIEKQRDFFTEGFSSLSPMTLKEVAEEIGMHESTISRATANKIIQTPKGSFELRKFFSSKLASEDGSSISQTKVKAWLVTLVANENKSKPLSDQKIADYFLKEKGISISRRTVTKYREELKILSSPMRKVLKAE